VLTPADDVHHINKHAFKVPFVCGCRDLGEALRRVAEGAAMIRTKGEAGTGNVVEAVRHARAVQGAIRQLQTMDDDELYVYAKVRYKGRGTRGAEHGAGLQCRQHLAGRWSTDEPCGACSSPAMRLLSSQSKPSKLHSPSPLLFAQVV
jgi:hypothetical protein